jgi:predicted nucleic acid-binding protein
MKVVIHDACALIDLLKGSLVELWIKCGIEIHTTQLALLEVEDDPAHLRNSGALRIRELSDADLGELLSFQKSFKALSLQDCSVLRLAQELDAPLLTGDKDLRAVAERNGMRVHGMLWVLDMMLEQGVLTTIDAARSLRLLLGEGSRFPRSECERRLKLWGG